AVFGAAAFRFYGFAGPPSEAEPQALAAFDRWLAHLVLAGAVIALGSGLLIVPCVAATMSGSPEAAFRSATLEAVLFGTAFGRAWCWHLGFTLLLVLTAAPQRWFGIAPALAGLALASLGFVGHAADQPGW